MSETSRLVFCNRVEECVATMNEVMPLLSPTTRKRLNGIKLALIMKYDLPGLFERVNGKTVAEILEMYGHEAPRPLVEDERDGVKFRLYGSDSDTPREDSAGTQD